MRILIAKEKHGDRYLDASTDELLETSSRKLIRERLDDVWYTEVKDQDEAKRILDHTEHNPKKTAWRFLQRMSNGEYEGVTLAKVESPEEETE